MNAVLTVSLLSATLATATSLVALYRTVKSAGPKLWFRLRLTALLSLLSPLLLIVGGVWHLNPIDVASFAAAFTLALVLLNIVAGVLDRKAKALLSLSFSGRATVRVRLLDRSRPIAFSVVAAGKIYASKDVLSLPEDVVCSIIAHEHGHLRISSLLPPRLWYPLVLLPPAFASYTLASLLLYDPAASLPALLVGALLILFSWAVFSWSWELYADLYSARLCGVEAVYRALSLATASRPCRPSLRLLLLELLKSLKPARAVGVALINPHPPPCLRLYVVSKLSL